MNIVFPRRILAVVTLAVPLGLFSTTVPAQDAEKHTYTIDPVHSAILWKVQHKGAGFTWGRFNDFSGTVTATGRDPESLVVDITVKANSVDSANAKRDEHLRGPDFFNATEFPTITFKSKSAKKLADDKVELTGDLTIRGVTKEIKAIAVFTGTGTDRGAKLAGAEATFTINRSDFGITYGKGALGEEVTIIAALEGKSD
jgi:polyisoprenoid-binding protein YceI